MPEKLLTVRETAERLNVSRQTVDLMIRARELSAVRVRGVWRVRDSAIEAYLESNTVAAQVA